MHLRSLLQEAIRVLRAPDNKSNRPQSTYLDLIVVLFVASLLVIQGVRVVSALLTR